MLYWEKRNTSFNLPEIISKFFFWCSASTEDAQNLLNFPALEPRVWHLRRDLGSCESPPVGKMILHAIRGITDCAIDLESTL